MIFKRAWVYDLLKDGYALDCRPIFHRNGRPMQYEVGGVYPVQPGRFALHVVHVRVVSMEPAFVGVLRVQDWEIPDDWPDTLGVQVMRLEVEGRKECCAPL